MVDAYFAKQTFVEQIKTKTDFEIISKFRKDARLKYLYTGPKKKGRGRPKKYAGDFYHKNPDMTYFELCHEDDEVQVYQAILWSTPLKRKVKVALVKYKDKKGKLTEPQAIYFSSDLELDGYLIYIYYKARFQIEFVFRDAKQHTGLTHCQARSENKLYFHFNISLIPKLRDQCGEGCALLR